MKTILLFFVFVGLTLLSGCGGSSSSAPAPEEPANNQWTIGTRSYAIPSSRLMIANTTSEFRIVLLYSEPTSTGTPNSSGLTFIFPSRPTANGNYTLINHGTASIGANQCKIIATVTPGNLQDSRGYSYNGTSLNNAVQVTVTNGKIRLTCSSITMSTASPAFQLETALLTATVQE